MQTMSPTELNNTVWATLGPSKIQGIGVIAIRDIPKGQKITIDFSEHREKHVMAYTEDALMAVKPEIRNLILDRALFEKGKILYFNNPNADVVLRGFMNHADDPNTDGHHTLKKIKKGEELTENYRDITANYEDGLHPLTVKHHKHL